MAGRHRKTSKVRARLRVGATIASVVASTLVVPIAAEAPSGASGATVPPTVTGIVRNGAGLPVPGATVTIELLPSNGYLTPGGAQVHTVATGVSDSAGAFGLTVPVNDDVRAEGAFNNGAVNFMISAVKEPSRPDVFRPTRTAVAVPTTGSVLSAVTDIGGTCRSLLSSQLTKTAVSCSMLDSAMNAASACTPSTELALSGASSTAAPPRQVTDFYTVTQATENVLAHASELTPTTVGFDVSAIVAYVSSIPAAQRHAVEAMLGDGSINTALATLAAWAGSPTQPNQAPSDADVRNAAAAVRDFVLTVTPVADPTRWLTVLPTAASVFAAAQQVAGDAGVTPRVTVTRPGVDQLTAAVDAIAPYRLAQITAALGGADIDAAIATIRAFVDSNVGDVSLDLPTTQQILDAAQTTVDALHAQVDGLVANVDTSPAFNRVHTTCEILAALAAPLARFVMGCGAGVAVGLASSTVNFTDYDATCYALGAQLRTAVDALIVLAKGCTDDADSTCGAVRDRALQALVNVAGIAGSCVNQVVPLTVVAAIDGSDELNCAGTIALVNSTVTTVTTTATNCVNGATAACHDAEQQLRAVTDVAAVCAAPLLQTAVPDVMFEVASPAKCPATVPLPGPNDVVDHVLIGAGAFHAQMSEQDNSATGIALQPVNIGVLTVNAALADAGGPGIAETPPDEPTANYSGNKTPLADTLNGDPSPLDHPTRVVLPQGDDVAPAEVTGAVPTNATTPPVMREVPSAVFAKADDDGGYTGDERCRQPKNWQTWIVDVVQRENHFEPVGEVHAGPDETVEYTYEQAARTNIGLAVKPEYKSWKLSGSTSMENSSGFKVDLPAMPGSFARLVLAEFKFVHEKLTWCPYGYPDDRSGSPLHQERIRSLQWTGGLDYDSRDRSQFDEYEDYQAAADAGHATAVRKGGTVEKYKGKTFKYGASASAFGVTLSAESTNDTKHKLTLRVGQKRQWYQIWGDRDVPSNPSNHAIYTY